MKMIHSPALITLPLVFLAACSSPLIATPTSLLPDQPAAPTDQPAQSVFGEGTFTIDLPEGWDIASEEISSDANGTYVLYLLGEDPAVNHGPGTSRVVIANADEWTPEEFALSQCSTCPENPFESTTLDGKPALRTEIGGGGVPFRITWYFVQHNGKLIAFAIHDPETLLPLDKVIASIQFE
jgi:hypothetical protein